MYTRDLLGAALWFYGFEMCNSSSSTSIRAADAWSFALAIKYGEVK